jgi:hypothetical protein
MIKEPEYYDLKTIFEKNKYDLTVKREKTESDYYFTFYTDGIYSKYTVDGHIWKHLTKEDIFATDYYIVEEMRPITSRLEEVRIMDALETEEKTH